MEKLLKELLITMSNERTFHMIRINDVSIFFDAFEYEAVTECVKFYNNGLFTASIFETNINTFKVVQ